MATEVFDYNHGDDPIVEVIVDQVGRILEQTGVLDDRATPEIQEAVRCAAQLLLTTMSYTGDYTPGNLDDSISTDVAEYLANCTVSPENIESHRLVFNVEHGYPADAS